MPLRKRQEIQTVPREVKDLQQTNDECILQDDIDEVYGMLEPEVKHDLRETAKRLSELRGSL
jgi:hypothetical protein